MAAAPSSQKDLVRPAAQEGLKTIVYERNVEREIRVLEAKMGKLELQLNKEREKISSCSGLLEEIIAKPQGSPCASLRAELDRVRAKREKAYHKFELQQLQQEKDQIQGDKDDDDNVPNPPADDAAVSAPPATN